MGAWGTSDERSAGEGAGLAARVDTCRMWSVTDHMGSRHGRGLEAYDASWRRRARTLRRRV
ncbi:hypothetical protein MA16_Dca008515 [Dendrobium catenatum]|uniref:Uncharacterized protein n=1 Tax=Dendrobium catenatum TaxID=906689 RepID=A0A2I0XHP1_9ASPA|nr:hypothetical protein MA16_Dca008515 [Dendrobium catenatum]